MDQIVETKSYFFSKIIINVKKRNIPCEYLTFRKDVTYLSFLKLLNCIQSDEILKQEKSALPFGICKLKYKNKPILETLGHLELWNWKKHKRKLFEAFPKFHFCRFKNDNFLIFFRKLPVFLNHIFFYVKFVFLFFLRNFNFNILTETLRNLLQPLKFYGIWSPKNFLFGIV